MSQRWRNLLFMAAGSLMLSASCKKTVSTDKPLPTSYYPSIVLSSDNRVVYAINPSTGTRNWEYSIPNGSWGAAALFAPSPLIYNDMIYMGSVNSDTLYKINAKTGLLVAKLVLPNQSSATLQATPIADGKYIYLATTADSVFAIDTGSGAVHWRFGAANDPSPYVSSPVIYNGNIYVASTGGHVYCIDKVNGPDATTGYPIWDYPGWGITDTLTPSFVSSPAISYPYLYVGSNSDSNMYCINLNPPVVSGVTPTTGILKWIYKTRGNIQSSPTAYAGMCIFGSNDFNVYCVDSMTGLSRWTTPFRTGSQINSSPIISNQTVYIGSYDLNLYAINIIDGSQKWKFATKGLIKSSPLPYNGYVYIGSYDGYLYAVDSAFGVQKWSFKIDGNIECSPAIDDYTGTQYNSGISGFNTSGTNN